MECIPIDGECTKFTTYRPGDTSLEVLTEQTDQVAGFSLVAANGDTLFYSIQHSTIENDETKWWNALVAYDIATGENRMVTELINHIDVYHAEQVDGEITQEVKIFYNCIGAFEVPDRESIP